MGLSGHAHGHGAEDLSPPRKTTRAEYDPWAAFYDVVHPGLPGEAEFYAIRALNAGGACLELGCGTGRVALPIAMSGGRVLGLDLSRRMLGVCSQKRAQVAPLNGALHLVQADMRRFAFGGSFHTILMPYRTFMHLLTVPDRLACLQCVRAHLAPGGRFICNLWAARAATLAALERPLFENTWRLAGHYEVRGKAITLRHYYGAKYDDFSHVLVERHRLTELTEDGCESQSHYLDMRRACLSVPEMQELFDRAGLRVQAVYGAFDESPLTPESTEMIWEVSR